MQTHLGKTPVETGQGSAKSTAYIQAPLPIGNPGRITNLMRQVYGIVKTAPRLNP